MRKLIPVLVAVAALGMAGTAAAAHNPTPTPDVLCCTGGGFTGCSSISVQHSFSWTFIASIKHVLIVNYCKSGGIITSLSIAAHYCDTGGFVSCSPTVAWQSGGGVGSGSASFEAHASWTVTSLHLYNNTDVLNLTVPAG